MKKRMYNAPEITVLEMVAASMIAASVENTVTGDGTTVEYNKNTVGTASGSSARIGSRQYFDTWSDDEEEW